MGQLTTELNYWQGLDNLTPEPEGEEERKLKAESLETFDAKEGSMTGNKLSTAV